MLGDIVNNFVCALIEIAKLTAACSLPICPAISSQLQQADILVSEPALIAKHMSSLSNVRWVHLIWAGTSL